MSTPERERAHDLVIAWLACTAPDESGTAARHLYEHFILFCQTQHGEGLSGSDGGFPTETMWGRELSRLGITTRQTARGRTRQLRVLSDEPAETSAWPAHPDGSPNYPSGMSSQVNQGLSVVTSSEGGGNANATQLFKKRAGLGSASSDGFGGHFFKSPDSSPEEPPPTANQSPPLRLFWPKWQEKLEEAETPGEQVDVGLRALGAVIHRTRKATDQTALAAWLVDSANRVGAGVAGLPAAPAAAIKPAAARHTIGPDGLVEHKRACPCVECVRYWREMDHEYKHAYDDVVPPLDVVPPFDKVAYARLVAEQQKPRQDGAA